MFSMSLAVMVFISVRGGRVLQNVHKGGFGTWIFVPNEDIRTLIRGDGDIIFSSLTLKGDAD